MMPNRQRVFKISSIAAGCSFVLGMWLPHNKFSAAIFLVLVASVLLMFILHQEEKAAH